MKITTQQLVELTDDTTGKALRVRLDTNTGQGAVEIDDPGLSSVLRVPMSADQIRTLARLVSNPGLFAADGSVDALTVSCDGELFTVALRSPSGADVREVSVPTADGDSLGKAIRFTFFYG